ncbi:MAG: hypothetical protein DDT24_00429 [Chloroflexi bacterium]|nr:hypothetical protein [Chloroflexota bacterium]
MDFVKGLIQFPRVFFVGILPVIHPHQFICRISKNPAQRIIEKGKVPRDINLVIALFNVLQNRSMLLLALSQRLLRLPARLLQFDAVQGEGDVAGNLLEQGSLFLVCVETCGDRDIQQAVYLTGMCQPHRHRHCPGVLRHKVTITADRWRVFHHHDVRLLKRPLDANRRLAAPQMLQQGQEMLAEAGLGRRHQPPGLI